MTEMKKINDQALENVVGGVTRTINNDAVNYANIRDDAGLNAPVLTKMKNGTKVELTGNPKSRVISTQNIRRPERPVCPETFGHVQ